MVSCIQNALAAVSSLVAIAKFDGFALAVDAPEGTLAVAFTPFDGLL